MSKDRITVNAVPVERRLKLLAGGAIVATLLAAWLVAAPRAKATPGQRFAAGAAIKVAKNKLGQIIVDSRGRTVYLFEKDKNNQSACYGACAKFWPPLLAKGKPTAGTGAKASLLGVVMRKDGTHQLTYGGHPLYGFVKDKAPGQATGQGLNFFGGGWDVLGPSGNKLEGSPAKSTSSSGSGSGSYGYGG
jgi:predicted lipoprotein with Yx(FWY)xxD motif